MWSTFLLAVVAVVVGVRRYVQRRRGQYTQYNTLIMKEGDV